MCTPVNPSFTIQKWGLRGSKLYRHVFVINGKKESQLDQTPQNDLSLKTIYYNSRINLKLIDGQCFCYSTCGIAGDKAHFSRKHVSHLMIKPTKWHVRHAKTNQPGHPPSLIRVFACAQWVVKDPSFLHADSEDSDQTGRMPRLIRVFAGRTCHFVGFVM